MIHELKTLPHFFTAVIKGEKTFEIRKNDRPFKKGDLLALNEHTGQFYTGRSCIVYIDYIMNDINYVKKDMVILGIKPCAVIKYVKPFLDKVYEHMDYTVPLATNNEYEVKFEQSHSTKKGGAE